MGAIRYSCPIRLFPTYILPADPAGSDLYTTCKRCRLVPTHILPAKDIRLLEKFQPDSFKTERQVCVETDGQNSFKTERLVFVETDGQTSEISAFIRTDGKTVMARSTRLVILIKNIYPLWYLNRLG